MVDLFDMSDFITEKYYEIWEVWNDCDKPVKKGTYGKELSIVADDIHVGIICVNALNKMNKSDDTHFMLLEFLYDGKRKKFNDAIVNF